MEHVAHARSSAAHCATAVLDDTFATEYKYFPFFYSRVFEQKDQARALNWAFWGFARDTADVVVVGDFAPKLCAFWIDGGKVVGAMCESGTEEERDVCKNAATRKVPVDTQALKKCHCVEGAIALLR
jgi:monodehydroascorbate reductase (NADH)